MIRLISIMILSGIFLSPCFSQDRDPYRFEQEVCHCIYDAYDSIGLDIKSELLLFERYLIEKKQLKDSSGAAYYDIFVTVASEGDVPIRSGYRIEKLNFETFPLFSACFYSLSEDSLFLSSHSKLRSIYREFGNNIENGRIDPASAAKAILKVLDANDFGNEFYRIYALHTFYYTANPIAQRSALPAPIIEIRVTEQNEIFVDGDLTPLDSIPSRIVCLTNNYSEVSKDHYIVNLKVQAAVKMGIVADIKEKLRQVNATRIQYEKD